MAHGVRRPSASGAQVYGYALEFHESHRKLSFKIGIAAHRGLGKCFIKGKDFKAALEPLDKALILAEVHADAALQEVPAPFRRPRPPPLQRDVLEAVGGSMRVLKGAVRTAVGGQRRLQGGWRAVGCGPQWSGRNEPSKARFGLGWVGTGRHTGGGLQASASVPARHWSQIPCCPVPRPSGRGPPPWTTPVALVPSWCLCVGGGRGGGGQGIYSNG